MAAVVFAAPTAQAQTPSLSLSPSSGPVESGFTARGSGFPGCPGGFSVTWDAPAVSYPGNPATWTATSFVPQRTGVGVHTVTVSCATGGSPAFVTAAAAFQVTATPTTAGPVYETPVVELPPSRIPVETPLQATPVPPPTPSPDASSATTLAPAPPNTLAPVTTAAVLATPPLGKSAGDSDSGLPIGLVIAGFVALIAAAAAFLFGYRSRQRGADLEPVIPVAALAPAPRRNLSQVADSVLGADELPSLARAGPATARIAEACGGDDGVATPLIATLLWESVVTDDGFASTLRDAGASDRALQEGRFVVVRHAGETRHDLLVLDPGYTGAEPTAMPVEIWPSAASSAGRRERLSWSSLLANGDEPWSELEEATILSALEEAAGTERFGVIVAEPPRVLVTHAPSPAWPVAVGGRRAPVATAGALVEGVDGSMAVTTALHAVKGHSSISVARRAGTLTSIDEATDSCLISLADLPLDGPGWGRRGPVRGISPRLNGRLAFDGVGSGRSTTTVTGWDVGILNPASAGSRVYTGADTVPGDSGAGLVDGADQIVGFAVERSAFGEPIEYSAWVWADQVFAAHGARPSRTTVLRGELVR